MASYQLDTLSQLYEDSKACAELVGLAYVSDDMPGLKRKRHGRGYTYLDEQDQTIRNKQLKKRITELAIPPAWQKVWICPVESGHILATGIDDKGRKQYIYHPKWQKARNLIKFYRLIHFAEALPDIRSTIGKDLQSTDSRSRTLATMVWILDNLYIRIGNDIYFEENSSMGLSTLTKKTLTMEGPVANISFKGKSGKDIHLSFENKEIAKNLQKLMRLSGDRLFQYASDAGPPTPLAAEDVNTYLRNITDTLVSAKDFRTWGGTLLAYIHIKNHLDSSKKDKKIEVEAVDRAAGVLGNTRSVARQSYVHPHLLEALTENTIKKHYQKVKARKSYYRLSKDESELLDLLKTLVKEEFELLQKS